MAKPRTKTGLLFGTAGVKTNVDDWNRPPVALKVANNVNMIQRGIITTRFNGWSRQRAGAFNASAQFLDFATFTDNVGTQTLCFQCGDKIYSYDGATETAIATGKSTTNPPCFRSFVPYNTGAPLLLYANGVDQPLKITSVAASAALQLNGGNYPQATAAPLPVRTYGKPKFIEPFLDRVCIAGFPDATTAFDVLITNSGTCETVSQSAPLVATDGGIFTVDPSLGPITGMKAFKLTNQTNDQIVLVFQAAGVSIITGNSAASNVSGLTQFKMFVLTREYGVPSNRAVVQLQNDLWFLATDGIRRFSALSQNANLINAALTYDVQDLMNRINPSYAQWAFMTHHRQYQEVACWFPLDTATQNDHALVINYNQSNGMNTLDWQPEVVMPIFFTKDGTTVACGKYFNGIWYGGGYTGLLQVHYSGNQYDGSPVSWDLVPALVKSDDPELYSVFDMFEIITQGGSQNFLCTAYAYNYNPALNTLQRSAANPALNPISVALPAGTVLGTWKLDVSLFPSNVLQMHRFQPVLTSQIAELELSGNQPNHTIDFIGIKHRFREGNVA